jgi:hypothetical protein
LESRRRFRAALSLDGHSRGRAAQPAGRLRSAQLTGHDDMRATPSTSLASVRGSRINGGPYRAVACDRLGTLKDSAPARPTGQSRGHNLLVTPELPAYDPSPAVLRILTKDYRKDWVTDTAPGK